MPLAAPLGENTPITCSRFPDKYIFATEERAYAYIRRVRERNNRGEGDLKGKLYPYQCKQCNYFHLSSHKDPIT